MCLALGKASSAGARRTLQPLPALRDLSHLPAPAPVLYMPFHLCLVSEVLSPGLTEVNFSVSHFSCCILDGFQNEKQEMLAFAHQVQTRSQPTF